MREAQTEGIFGRALLGVTVLGLGFGPLWVLVTAALIYLVPWLSTYTEVSPLNGDTVEFTYPYAFTVAAAGALAAAAMVIIALLIGFILSSWGVLSTIGGRLDSSSERYESLAGDASMDAPSPTSIQVLQLLGDVRSPEMYLAEVRAWVAEHEDATELRVELHLDALAMEPAQLEELQGLLSAELNGRGQLTTELTGAS